jgi:hypothetical protein
MLSEDQDGHWIDRLEEANAKKKKARKGQQGSKRSSASRQARLGTARTTRIVLGVGDDPHAGRHEKACPWSRWPDPVAVSPETAPARERGRGVKKKDYSSTPCRALMAGLRVASPRGVSGSPGSAQDTPLARSCARRRVSALAELGTLPAMLSLPFVNWEYLCCQLGMMVSYNT